jgi:hypothetical protein
MEILTKFNQIDIISLLNQFNNNNQKLKISKLIKKQT